MEQKAYEAKCAKRRLVLLKHLQLDKQQTNNTELVPHKTAGQRDDDVVIVAAVRTPIGRMLIVCDPKLTFL